MDRILKSRESLRRRLDAENLDALLISSATNVTYLTGFTGDSSVLLLGRQGDVILSDFRFTTQIAQECPGLEASIRPKAKNDGSGGCSPSEIAWRQTAGLRVCRAHRG